MSKFVQMISIGLNVGDREPACQLSDTFNAVDAHLGAPFAVAMGRSEWEGVPERFMQFAIYSGPLIVARRLPALARVLRQDAIALLERGEDGREAWTLYHADGRVAPGGSVEDFPVIIEVPNEQE